MKTITKALPLLSLWVVMANVQAQLPVDRVSKKITFKDTIWTSLDSIRTTEVLTDHLFTNYQNTKQNRNKVYTTANFDVHKKGLSGGITKQVFGNISFTIIAEIRNGYLLFTRTNFIFQGMHNTNEVFPDAGKIEVIGEPKPLEEKKVNKEEVLIRMDQQKAIFHQLIN